MRFFDRQRRTHMMLVSITLLSLGIVGCGSTAALGTTPPSATATPMHTSAPIPSTATTSPTQPTATPIAPSSTTGVILGTVVISSCPVVSADPGCAAKPVPNQQVNILAATDNAVMTKTTDSNGNFSVALAPGNYTIKVTTQAPGTVSKAQAQLVTVVSGQTVKVTIALDSGIR